MRQHGYNAVSYRDIAAEMGIKSASLHYHFPKKVDLGTELVRRYADTFHKSLESRAEKSDVGNLKAASTNVDIFIDLHRRALKDQQLICLCAILGAEAESLPEAVTQKVREFFEANIAWLTSVFDKAGLPNSNSRAKASISALEGAMIVASVNKDMSVFEAAAEFVQIPSS